MIVLGRVGAPHGIQGWIKVQAYGDDPASWKRMPAWWVGDGERWQEYRLEACRAQRGSLVAKLAGIDDRTAAERLAGQLIAAPRQSLPTTRPNEFYWADLIGLEVRNCDGQPLGRVAELIDAGVHAVLRVTDSHERERLIPFVEPVIREVDLGARTVMVDWGTDW